jgi:AcrR family transcriptional regulator
MGEVKGTDKRRARRATTPPASGDGRGRASRRSEILDATLRVIEREGVDGVRSVLVAEEAGVSIGLPHYYFPTQTQLIRAAFRHDTVRIQAAYERPATGVADPLARAGSVLRSTFEGSTAVRHGRHALWLEFEGAAVFDAMLRRMMGGRVAFWLDEATAALEEARDLGAVRQDADARLSAVRLAVLHDGLMAFDLLGAISPRRAATLIDGALERDPTVRERRPSHPPTAPGAPAAGAGDTREAILDAALRLVTREGLKGLHFPELAEEAGVSSTLPRYYFPTIEDLRRALFQHDDTHRRALVAAASVDEDPLERLRTAYLYEVALPPEERRSAWALWIESLRLARHDAVVRDLDRERLARWRAYDLELVRALQADGRVPSDLDAEAAVDRMMAVLQGAGTYLAMEAIDLATFTAAVDATISWELGLEPGRPLS